MKKRLLLAVPLLLCVVVVAWWVRPHGKPSSEGYVSERFTTLWSSLAQVREPVATLHYGDRVEVLERRGERVKVRTDAGTIGWLDAHLFMDASLWQQSTQLLAQSQNLPVQSRGRTKVSTNVRVEPGRTGARLYQWGRGVEVEVLARAVADWTSSSDVGIPGSQIAGQEEPKKEDWFLVRGQATSGPEETGNTVAKSREMPNPPESAGQTVPIAGWIVARFIELDLPDPVRKYAVASGTRVMACFELNRVSDLAGDKPNFLAAGTQGGQGRPCDFSIIHVYTWSTRRGHYETSFAERNLCGKLPIRVEKTAAGEAEFHFKDIGSSGEEERKYRLKQNIVRRVRGPGENAQTPRSKSPSR